MTDFKAKTHQIRFRLGLGPIPRCLSVSQSLYTFYDFTHFILAYSAPPDPLAGFWGRFAAGGGGSGGKGEGEGGRGKWRGGKGRAPT